MFWLKFRDRLVCVRIILLDSHELEYDCQVSIKGRELLDYVLDHLKLLEREYFGLRYLDADSQVHWLDTGKSLRKQLRKCTEPYVFYFCVKYYSSEPALLQEERTKYQFFLQLKRDLLYETLNSSFEARAELGAYALQFEIGSYDPLRHEPGYASEFTRSNFAPDPSGRLVRAIETKHQTLRGQTQSVAERNFLDRARRLDFYGVDMHPVTAPDTSGGSSFFLGLSPTGVMLIQDDVRGGEYAWPIISKIDKDVDTIWPTSSRIRGGSLMIHLRSKDGSAHAMGFRMATKEACKHLWKTALEHRDFNRKLRGEEEVRTPSLSSRILRLGSRFRSASRAESDTTSGDTSIVDRRGDHRFQPKFERPKSSTQPARQRLPSSSVIHEDETRSMLRRPECQSISMPRRQLLSTTLVDMDDEITELRSAPVIGRGRNGTQSRRSVSPMSMQSSFSTCPRRLPAPVRMVEHDNDNDSVFSGSSRMSHMTNGDDTFGRKRKRSTLGENNSSGASEEADHVAGGTANQRAGTLRTSLGPERRRIKNPHRHKTHDGSSIQQAMAQLNARSMQYDRELSLPERLMQVMQPAKSMTMITATRQRPALSLYPNLGKSMNQLNSVAINMGGGPLFPVHPAETLYLNSNTLNPPITPSAKLKGFEFKFGNPAPVVAHCREIPTSSSWTAGEHSSDHLKYIVPSPSPIKSKSFDFKIDVPRSPAPVESPSVQDSGSPRHVRSQSSSGPGTSRRGPVPACRSRLRSDSCFNSSTTDRNGEDYEEVGRYAKESSPMLSPYPIIPPPTPFSEESLSSPMPPAVPARNPGPLASKSTAKRLGLSSGGLPSRSDSFHSAVQNPADCIEMQTLRPPPVQDIFHRTADETVVVHEVLTHVVVEADVHLSMQSEQVYDALPAAGSRRKLATPGFPATQPLQTSTVHNQGYMEMNFGSESGQESHPPSPSKISHAAKRSDGLVRPIAVHPAQLQQPPTPSTNGTPLSHPLAMVHSTRRNTVKPDWYSQNGSTGTNSSQSSPTDENDPMPLQHGGVGLSKKLQSMYSSRDDYAKSTHI